METKPIKTTHNDRYQLELAISSEKAAYENYRDLSEIVKNEKAKRRLEEFASEEKGHFIALVKKYEQFFGQRFSLDTAGRMTGPLCDALWNFLSEDEKKSPELKIYRIIELAIFEEKAAITMYTRAANQTKFSELKKFFAKLAEIEKEHLNDLREEQRKAKKDAYWLKD
ncbi:MAG: ferritin family protein [Candidatus Aminicenantes bacterium]|nr:MAG: ferritin family protein [Candidatus Aminicenantes bacterium]